LHISPAHARDVTINMPEHAAHALIFPSCARRPCTNRATASALAHPPEGGRRAGAWARMRGSGPPEGRQQLDLRPVECEEAGSGAWVGLERRRRASGDADLSHGFVTGSGQGSPIQVCLCARRLARPCAGRRPNLRKPAGATWLPRIPLPMSAETCTGHHQPQIPGEKIPGTDQERPFTRNHDGFRLD
jgi:hypothetical protein